MSHKVVMCCLSVFLFSSNTFTQSTKTVMVTDDNFKDMVAKGFVVMQFTAKWSENGSVNFLKELNGYQGAAVLEAESENVRKVVKKLRLRNFPSIVLFYKGDKIEVWKGDMDGVLELSTKELKKSIDNVLSADVF